MNKCTIIGGGAWGATLGQVLTDNHYQILIHEQNPEYIKKINNNQHPVFQSELKNIKATNNLEKSLFYSDTIILCLPVQNIRSFLKKINPIINMPKNFINTSKGIEINSNKTISQITQEEISQKKIINYGCLMGPSHAEEVILRKITFLLAASNNLNFTQKIIKMFFNSRYLKVFNSYDVIGCEICSAFKNVLSLISGILENNNFQNNAKAAFISLGVMEMAKLIKFFKAKKETVFSISGLGDLIVTTFNENSRNYKAGKQISLGIGWKEICSHSSQTIEGIYSLEAFYNISLQKNINLPIIKSAYQVVFRQKPTAHILSTIFQNDYI
ncbi:MAG: NAD(P)-binding domain-containing protein [Weeping tea tree witches'-broom phytoplasma]|uniref:NAD(P)H-dependent glycerol-3-phosphate dehydrogenase n=1 Tax=Candidatus Phytoplasma melaleucae TaxID=2982630 RepID=UPI0029398CE2|nr:NAD(P)-binding domain-containing protein [Weeping tea tree witches'-broom phytoplasma]